MLGVLRCSLAREVQGLPNNFMRLQVTNKGAFLANFEDSSTFLDKIKKRQFEDEKLNKI